MAEPWHAVSDSSEIIDVHPAALIVVGADGRIATWNRTAAELLGYESEEAIGQDYESLLVPTDQADLRKRLVKQIANGESACFVAGRRHKDGTIIPVAVVMDAGNGEASGTLYLSLRLASRMACLCDAPSPDASRGVRALTTRQRQVLRFMAEGRSTRDIATRLNLSVKTIETHRGHLMSRLKLKSVAGLVRYAVSLGLVPASPWASRGGSA
jgi:PAS domain S-box-containing protein